MRPHTAAFLAAAVLFVAPASAVANDHIPTAYGGISFSDSDRDSQASNDTLALDVDPAGDRVESLGLAGGKAYAYRYDASGKQLSRFKVTAAAAVGIASDRDIYTGDRSGTVRHY